MTDGDPEASGSGASEGSGAPDPPGDPGDPDSPGSPGDPDRLGVPATKRARARSAALWGFVGGFSFLVLVQGYLLLDSDLPFGIPGLFTLAAAIAVASGGFAYATEHRL